MSKMNWDDIPRPLDFNGYAADVPWSLLEGWISSMREDQEAMNGTFEMCPDFQRGHVWTEEQQIKYVEFCLQGGTSGMRIYWNCPNYDKGEREGTNMVLVDGLQRLTAIRRFMNNEIGVFGGHKFGDFEGTFSITGHRVRMCVNQLPHRKDVLAWYLALNDGGVVHSKEEILRVRELLNQED